MNNPEKYPIGIQTFSEIIRKGYIYVDKTSYISKLEQAGKYIFLSRPRRFGKSLLLSTLHSYFSGEKELFDGLEISKRNLKWEELPVLHFDFNPQNYLDENALEYLLNDILSGYEKEYEVKDISESLNGRFSLLLERIFKKTGRQVVILVDEYDKPLLGLEEKGALFNKNQGILKGFFSVLKTQDRFIHFAMLTGVARFNKVSIFSDLNNLNDISFDEEFSAICGWTQNELEHYFPIGIDLLSKKINLSYKSTLKELKATYDGYLFAEDGERLYNPFSVLNALSKRKLSYYWFHTGTPNFLAKKVRRSGILLPSLNSFRCSEESLFSIGLDNRNPVPILFQTGYLTIKRVVGRMYELQFPNKEVENGFAQFLQPLYLPQMNNSSGPFSIWDFQTELVNGEPEKFMERMAAMIKAVPYEQHNENFYQNLIYLLFTLVGIDARMEEHSNIGRPDLVVKTDRFIYVFEFKYNGSATEAIRQIREKDYFGRYAFDGKTIYIIGANFSSEKRGLVDYIIEKLT